MRQGDEEQKKDAPQRTPGQTQGQKVWVREDAPQREGYKYTHTVQKRARPLPSLGSIRHGLTLGCWSLQLAARPSTST